MRRFRYVYEAGALKRPGKGNVKVIDDKLLEKVRIRGFELNKNDRFRYQMEKLLIDL